MKDVTFPAGLKVVRAPWVLHGEMLLMTPDGVDQPSNWNEMSLPERLAFASAIDATVVINDRSDA